MFDPMEPEEFIDFALTAEHVGDTQYRDLYPDYIRFDDSDQEPHPLDIAFRPGPSCYERNYRPNRRKIVKAPPEVRNLVRDVDNLKETFDRGVHAADSTIKKYDESVRALRRDVSRKHRVHPLLACGLIFVGILNLLVLFAAMMFYLAH